VIGAHAAVFLESLTEQQQVGNPGDLEAVDGGRSWKSSQVWMMLFLIASMSAPTKIYITALSPRTLIE
jgi:hypothetical protein